MKAWDRQDNESAAAFRYFVLYRDWPHENDGQTRTVEKVLKKCGKTRSYIEKLCNRFDWVERSRKYDDHLDSKKQDALHDMRVEAQLRQAQIARNIQGWNIQTFQSKAFRDRFAKGDIALKEAYDGLKFGVELERLALGMNDMPVNDEGGGNGNEDVPNAIIMLPREQGYGPDDEVLTDE